MFDDDEADDDPSTILVFLWISTPTSLPEQYSVRYATLIDVPTMH